MSTDLVEPDSETLTGAIKDICGCSLMVEPQPSKLTTGVRFSSSAPYVKIVELEIVRFFLHNFSHNKFL